MMRYLVALCILGLPLGLAALSIDPLAIGGVGIAACAAAAYLAAGAHARAVELQGEGHGSRRMIRRLELSSADSAAIDRATVEACSPPPSARTARFERRGDDNSRMPTILPFRRGTPVSS